MEVLKMGKDSKYTVGLKIERSQVEEGKRGEIRSFGKNKMMSDITFFWHFNLTLLYL